MGKGTVWVSRRIAGAAVTVAVVSMVAAGPVGAHGDEDEEEPRRSSSSARRSRRGQHSG